MSNLALSSSNLLALRRAVQAEVYRRDFKAFCMAAWNEIDPAPLIWAPHMDALCIHLQAVADGRVRKLLINIPPGHAKSMLVGVLWPVWLWLREPSKRIMAASYGLDLAMRDAVKSRDLMSTPWFTETFGRDWVLKADQNVKSRYDNTAKGFRVALSVGGKATGFRGDCLVGETLVSTEFGQISIRELHLMQNKPRVWTAGENGLELKPIVASRVIHNAIVGNIDFKTGASLVCTHDHRIATGFSYRSAASLKVFDKTFAIGCGAMPCGTPQIFADAVSVPWRPCEGTHDVYDIEVEGNHNFFANSILVHNCLLIDDPLNATDSHSKLARDTVVRWKTETMSSRFNNMATAIEVVIMQRLHEEDLSGHLLKAGGWCHLNLATEYEPATHCSTKDDAGNPLWSDWRSTVGELLFEAKFPRHVVDEIKSGRGMGAYAFAGQHQQRPAPASGGLLKREWFSKRWTELPKKFDKVVIIADAAFKKTEDSDKVAIQVWAKHKNEAWLLDTRWDRMGFTETVSSIIALRNKWPQVSQVCIEDRANGSAIIEVLKDKIPGVIGIQPEGGKESRVAAISAYLEAGNVVFPVDAWMAEFVEECVAFPKAPNDDAVDAMAYGVFRLLHNHSFWAMEALGKL